LFDANGQRERKLGEVFDELAHNHAFEKTLRVGGIAGGGVPQENKPGIDHGIADTLVLGNVIDTVKYYFDQIRLPEAHRNLLFKVKSVPDFAIERGTVVTGMPSTALSYFEEDQGGFHGAPVRIARDPRFRPQCKDGLKVKPEEEWKHRHEMYGRRLV